MSDEQQKLGAPFIVDMALNMLGLTYEQKQQVAAQIPTITHMISAINNANTKENPLIQDANALLVRAQPLIDVVVKDWAKAAPAIQIILQAVKGKNLGQFSQQLQDHIEKGGGPR